MRWILLLLALLTVAAAIPDALSPAQVDRLLRQGRTAFDQGDFTTALHHLERAEPLADDPASVTFALACTELRLALRGGDAAVGHLRKGEDLFRCLIGPGERYRVRALLGLSNCLLLRAIRQRDHAACTEALNQLETCVQLAPEEPFGSAARRFLHRARLLEWQLLPPLVDPKAPEQPMGEPDKQPAEKDKKTEKSPGEKDLKGEKDKGQKGTQAVPVEDPNGTAKEKKDGPQGSRAAEGNQAAIQDRKPLANPPERAAALKKLQDATLLIQAEQKVFRKSLVRPPVQGVPDW